MKYILGKNIEIKFATIEQLNVIIDFQSRILSNMSNKDMFLSLTYQEFEDAINNGYIYLLYYDFQLIGLCVLNCLPKKEIILEYQLENNDGVGILDSVMIDEIYRGSGLQRQILEYIDNNIKNFNLNAIVATVHPDNIWSCNNFLKCGYKIINRIVIHGGDRDILYKSYN